MNGNSNPNLTKLLRRNVELIRSGWVYDRSLTMSIDLQEKATQSGSSYVENPIRYVSVLRFQNKNKNLIGV